MHVRMLNLNMFETKVGRLFIIGVAHVDKTSVERVRSAIHREAPSVVALELCEGRLAALKSHEDQSPSWNRNILFWLFEVLERTIGKELGVSPGTEMLEASKAAQDVGARLELIDMPISQVASCIDDLPFSEKARLFIDGLTTLFEFTLPWKEKPSLPTSPDEAIVEFRDRYPTLYECLVEDRNRYMAARLRSLLFNTTGLVLVVVGLGHMKWLVQKFTIPEQQGSPYSFGWTIGSS